MFSHPGTQARAWEGNLLKAGKRSCSWSRSVGQKLVVGDVDTAGITVLRQDADGARAPARFVSLHLPVAC